MAPHSFVGFLLGGVDCRGNWMDTCSSGSCDFLIVEGRKNVDFLFAEGQPDEVIHMSSPVN